MSDRTDGTELVSRRSLLAAGGLAATGSLASLGATQQSEQRQSTEPEREVVVRQQPGETFYWVEPGPRRLSPQVFGTPDQPLRGRDLLELRVEQAKELPEPLGSAVPQLLEDLPPLVAAPEEHREPIQDQDAIAQERYAQPTLYSDEAQVTEGQFEVSYRDSRPYDLRGPPGETPDEVELSGQFTDPAGHEYEIDVDHVIQPPIPGYETGGGVLVDAWLHGITGTGSPMFPQAYTYGAFWGVGDVVVDGEVATQEGFRVIHYMTTQTVRDRQYRLALDEELPLAPENTIAGQIHHTHGVVLPIRPTPEGPVYDPVPTAYELPDGNTQPFIHAMWEQEELVQAPFADWQPPTGDQPVPANETADGGNETATDANQTADGGNQTTDGAGAAGADVRLGGVASGWIGAAPPSIEGQENPTLSLQAGTEYTLVWENQDGIQHNFAIEDQNGEDLLASDLVREQGATQTVTFTASAEMAEYYCQIHPLSMRGTIEVQ